MKREQFQIVLTSFLREPQPYRHLYLWHGEENDLASLLPPGRVLRLDLYELAAGLTRQPHTQDEAHDVLQDALQSRLRTWYQEDAETHPILLVAGCPLIARYRVSLQPFYNVLTAQTMVLLVTSAADTAYQPAGRLPDYVRCDPGATLAYLGPLVEDDHIVEPG